jgi:hypothetical protein
MNQFFWPDAAATSQLLTDLANEMAARGHDVHVICADGGYAVASGDFRPAVSIHRVKAAPFSRGNIGRMLSYLSFYVGAAMSGLRLPRPDMVLTLTTPPLLPLLGTLIKTLRGARHYIWEMDVYPDVAISLGYIKAGGLVDRCVGAMADFSRKQADGILALGQCMKDRLVRRGIAAERIFIAENWADSEAITPVPAAAEKDGKLALLYSGNLGLAHDIATIAGAMVALRESDRFSFIFIGGGARRAELQSFCERAQLTSVSFGPYVQRTNLGESLGIGDIGLVTQQEACCGAVVPSKVYGLLAAGRPVLFIGPADATPAAIIRQHGCGWHIRDGDIMALVALLHHLDEHRDEVLAAGVQARRVLLEHYDLPLGVARICELTGALSTAGAHVVPVAEEHAPARETQLHNKIA